jgi:hypothetical protein
MSKKNMHLEKETASVGGSFISSFAMVRAELAIAAGGLL